LTFFDHNRS
jgi:hypothetical protein